MASARIAFMAGSSGDDDLEAKACIPTLDISMMQSTEHFMVGKFPDLEKERLKAQTEMAANYLPRLTRPYYRAFASGSYAYRKDPTPRGKVCGRLIPPPSAFSSLGGKTGL
jgi:hypothetical protein